VRQGKKAKQFGNNIEYSISEK